MFIYIDESGVFKTANHPDAWCVVVAYITTERSVRSLEELMTSLKLKCGKTYKDEIKLKNLQEVEYIEFLKQLNKLDGTLYATATDMSLINESDVIQHRNIQSKKIVEHKEKLIHKSGKIALQSLSDQLAGLPPQLYTQLICQINLVVDVLNRGVLYYVQRFPKNLGRFKWLIDQKNSSKFDYETAFERLCPAIIQTISLEKPFIALRGEDYRAMEKFKYTKDNAPTYLRDTYGILTDLSDAFNVGKMLNDDLSFVDSKLSTGLQIADLLASGIRRLLRNEFVNNELVSEHIGKLTVQNSNNKPPINLISFTDSIVTKRETKIAIDRIKKYSRSILLKT